MNIVTALQAEARPLIDAFDLTGSDPDSPFDQYASEDLQLIVSGPGKTAAASAVSYLAGTIDADRPHPWLNVGVAGHPTRPVGDPVLAGEVIDDVTGERWYPQPVFPVEPDLETIRTVPEPERAFESPGAHDMEAAGFYGAALRFSTVERVHVLKIVSDGGNRSPDEVTADDVERLVDDNLETVKRIVNAWSDLRPRADAKAEAARIREWVTEACHLSVTQRRRLERLVERWRAVHPDRDLETFLQPEERDGGELLDRLATEIESASVHAFGAETPTS